MNERVHAIWGTVVAASVSVIFIFAVPSCQATRIEQMRVEAAAPPLSESQYFLNRCGSFPYASEKLKCMQMWAEAFKRLPKEVE